MKLTMISKMMKNHLNNNSLQTQIYNNKIVKNSISQGDNLK